LLEGAGVTVTASDASYALEHAPVAVAATEATVATSSLGETAAFRRIGLGALVLVTAVELVWVALLLVALVRYV
jgi:hypothetical protein